MIPWLLSASLLATPALAAKSDAETCLRTKVWEGYAEGWGVRTMTSSVIADGKTRNYLVTLYEGNVYLLRTCADDQAANVDVLIYDANGNLLARDSTVDREPQLSFAPTDTGSYYIVVYHRAAASPQGSATVAMAVTYR